MPVATDRSLARALGHGVAVALFCLFASPQPSRAQISLTEINPNSSTLDAADPDGATGGRVNGLAAVRGDNRSFFAASEWGGLFRTSDGGRTWTRLDGHLPVATWDVEVDPANTRRVYASSFYDGRANSMAGISVSGDGGATWTKPTSATPPAGFCLNAARRDEPSAFGIAIDPASSANVYVGTNCGLAVSNDTGATWRFVDPTPGDPADTIWDVVVNGATVDVCGDDGHMRSTNGGVTWTAATGTPLPSGRCSLAPSPDEAYVLFAVAGIRVYESDDGGANWANAYVNRSPQGRIPFVVTNDRSGTAFDLWFGDVQLWRGECDTPAALAPGGAARCEAAANWDGPFTRGAGAHDDTGDLVFDSQAAVDACPLLMASDGGVFYNTRTASPACHTPVWEQPNLTPHGLWLFGMAGVNQPGTGEELYFGCQDNGTFASTNASAPTPAWTNRDCCDGFDDSAESGRVLYTVCCWGGARANRLFVRGAGMAGGAELNRYPPGQLPGFRAIDVIDRFGPSQYVLITTSGVFITNNIGATPVSWDQLGAASTPAGACGVQAAGPAANPTFYVQAGACNGRGQDTLWRFLGTAPAGAWQQVNPPGGGGGFGLFAVDRSDPDRLGASHLGGPTGPHMVFSDDGGTTWAVDANLDALMIAGGAFRYQTTLGPTDFTGFGGYPQPTLVAFDPARAGVIVAGAADAGIFLTRDDRSTWTVVTNSSGTPRNPVVPRPRFAHFDHRRGGFDVYLGTQGRGVWRLSVEERIDVCRRFPGLCGRFELERFLIRIRCTSWPCVIFDPLPKNCLVKFQCPGCRPGGLCPPLYEITLDGLREDWGVGLVDAFGEPVEVALKRSNTRAVLRFQPTKESFKEGQIGDYVLVFQMPPTARPGSLEVRARLKVLDKKPR